MSPGATTQSESRELSAPSRHLYNAVCDGPEMRGSYKQHKVEQHKSVLLNIPHINSYQVDFVLKNNDPFLLGASAGRSSLWLSPVRGDISHRFTLWREPVPLPAFRNRQRDLQGNSLQVHNNIRNTAQGKVSKTVRTRFYHRSTPHSRSPLGGLRATVEPAAWHLKGTTD